MIGLRKSHRRWLVLVAALIVGASTVSLHAADPPAAPPTASPNAPAAPTMEQLASTLQATTVTVRVTLSPQDIATARKLAGETEDAGESGDADPLATAPLAEDSPAARVSVCSGVSLGNGLIVTSVFAGTDSKIKITLPDGEQATARPRVIDSYSGLILLETDRAKQPRLALADGLPAVGGQIMSAAAWGTQKPVVSMGIVSGVERTVSGSTYPPLIQCDLRTTETSSGAAIVDRGGKLLGVIVLAGHDRQQGGWTYAVPVAHVKRLVRVFNQRKQSSQQRSKDWIVMLQRRRPVVGMVLGGDNQQIVVRRVTPGSPAERAGVKVGDRVLAVEGTKIRSVYQAVRPILFKQPGDTIRYQIAAKAAPAGKDRSVQVQLGGGVELPSAPYRNLALYIRPKVEVEGMVAGGYRTRSGRGEIREVFAPGPDLDDPELQKRREATNAEKIQLLQRAVDSYRTVITYQQRELSRRDKERSAMEEQIRDLQRQIDALGKNGDK